MTFQCLSKSDLFIKMGHSMPLFSLFSIKAVDSKHVQY